LLIDKGDPDWTVVEFTADGVQEKQLTPSPFRREKHQQALPTPENGGSVADLFKSLPVEDKDDQILLQVWLCVALLPHIPRPGLVWYGPQGAGKSTACETVRSLIDPSGTPLLTLSKDEEAFVQVMDHNAIICLDNLRHLPPWVSDSLCRAVTGGGFSKRSHYTNDDDWLYAFRRTFMLCGINVAAASPDLLDRSILVGLDRIDEQTRMYLEDSVADFQKARPQIFGAILRALSKAMGNTYQLSLFEV
jgi:hypothetical protein